MSANDPKRTSASSVKAARMRPLKVRHHECHIAGVSISTRTTANGFQGEPPRHKILLSQLGWLLYGHANGRVLLLDLLPRRRDAKPVAAIDVDQRAASCRRVKVCISTDQASEDAMGRSCSWFARRAMTWMFLLALASMVGSLGLSSTSQAAAFKCDAAAKTCSCSGLQACMALSSTKKCKSDLKCTRSSCTCSMAIAKGGPGISHPPSVSWSCKEGHCECKGAQDCWDMNSADVCKGEKVKCARRFLLLRPP